MRIDVVTIFPEYLAPLRLSLLGRAHAGGLVEVAVHDLREWTHDVHRTVDDTPYGGGAGMVMRPEPWGEVLDFLAPSAPSAPGAGPAGSAGEPAASAEGGAVATARLVVPTPAGTVLSHALAEELAGESHLIFACGRYEGIDQRVIDHAATRMPVTEISLGDYVLFGGEVAVLVIVEAVTRLIPGVLGNAASLHDESHAGGLLESPVYTKPPAWRGLDVPEILRSGDHGRIARWRRDQALRRTAERRPDLLRALIARGERLDKHDIATLTEVGFRIETPDVAE